jgi:hypothetical protein
LQALFDLEATNNELKADLRDLYITAAKEVDVSARKAIIVHVSIMNHHACYVTQRGAMQIGAPRLHQKCIHQQSSGGNGELAAAPSRSDAGARMGQRHGATGRVSTAKFSSVQHGKQQQRQGAPQQLQAAAALTTAGAATVTALGSWWQQRSAARQSPK